MVAHRSGRLRSVKQLRETFKFFQQLDHAAADLRRGRSGPGQIRTGQIRTVVDFVLPEGVRDLSEPMSAHRTSRRNRDSTPRGSEATLAQRALAQRSRDGANPLAGTRVARGRADSRSEDAGSRTGSERSERR